MLFAVGPRILKSLTPVLAAVAALVVLGAGLEAGRPPASSAPSSSAPSRSAPSRSAPSSSTPSSHTARLADAVELPPTYWIAGADGGVYSLGSAPLYGSMAGRPLNAPVVGMAATPDHKGYWLVAADGGVFSFGDAGFFGSAGNLRLNAPVVGMASSVDGRGYWLVAADGGVFSFGDALFRGSLAAIHLPAPAIGIARTESLDPYTPATTGYDISWPQCGSSYPPPPFSFAIVGVGGKVTFTHNTCVASEVAWFEPALVDLYVKLSSPSFGDPTKAATGPAGTCAPTDAICLGYNYGWNLVYDAYAYANSQGVSSPLWWLDVERPSSSTDPLWSADTAANAQVVVAAIAALYSLGIQPGVYSNSYQWPLIVGSYSPNVPMWQARPNAASLPSESVQYCTSGTFTSGPVWLVQYGTTTFDQDLAC